MRWDGMELKSPEAADLPSNIDRTQLTAGSDGLSLDFGLAF